MMKDIFTRIYRKELHEIPVNRALEKRLRKQMQPTRPSPLFAFALMGGLAAIAFMIALPRIPGTGPVFGEQVDDWQYQSTRDGEFSSTAGMSSGGGVGGMLDAFSSAVTPRTVPYAAESMSDTLGFSVGGSKDINNFRLDIENDYLPLPTDVTYEGLYYDYFFETGESVDCDELFCPTYRTAVSHDPISGEEEHYLAVGLTSGMKESDVERKKLNLVIVLDNSGSMGASFDRYYYDRFGNQQENEEESSKSKMQVATDAIVDLLGHLHPEDRFGMVIFNSTASVAKPLSYVGETDMDAIAQHVLEITPTGGTNMSAGMELGTELLKEYADADPEEYETRMIFITDAMPNAGTVGKDDLLAVTEENADDRIHTTFIGVGVDFQTELVEGITKTRGANYYSVHSSNEFEERMDEGFDYMVNPLVFDLSLEIEAEGFEIAQVYGSPEADEATGEIMKINTLFPSESTDGETRGGIVLVKLEDTRGEGDIRIQTTYEDRSGQTHTNEANVHWNTEEADFYADDGIRKAILLARYADLLKNWMTDERNESLCPFGCEPLVTEEYGISEPPDWPPHTLLGQWEQQSMPLTVSEPYDEFFETFRDYFEEEAEAIGDEELEQEMEILDTLVQEA